jgi:hypothetical protein
MNHNLAPSQRQEWVGTTILYQMKHRQPVFFGLFHRTTLGQTHQGQVVNVTASSVAFRSSPVLDFFSGCKIERPECWVSLSDIHILDVLPPRS